MHFNFRNSDTVLLGNGSFAKEFLDVLNDLVPCPHVIECRKYPYDGSETDPLLIELQKVSPGRIILVGYLGNREAKPFPGAALNEMFMCSELPGAFAASRIALLDKHVRMLGFTPTRLREVIRSGQEVDGCLVGPSEADIALQDLKIVADAEANSFIRHDHDTLLLGNDRFYSTHTPTLLQISRVIAEFEGEGQPSATLVARKSLNPLESRYLSPAIAEQCAESGFERLTFVGENQILLDLERFRAISTESGLAIFLFRP